MTLIGIYRMKANNSKKVHWMLNRWIAKNPDRHRGSADSRENTPVLRNWLCVVSGDISCKAWSNYFCCWGDNFDNCSSGLSWTLARPPLSSPSENDRYLSKYFWFALYVVSLVSRVYFWKMLILSRMHFAGRCNDKCKNLKSRNRMCGWKAGAGPGDGSCISCQLEINIVTFAWCLQPQLLPPARPGCDCSLVLHKT